MLTVLQLSQLALRLIDDANRCIGWHEKNNGVQFIHFYFLMSTRDIIAIDTFNPADEYWIRVRHNEVASVDINIC